ncbi:MAG: DUF2635 domain-containing protein [Burkholderiales bacterium]|nr:DUF2635 domain-containing protein [Burkholderiales bacterium]
MDVQTQVDRVWVVPAEGLTVLNPLDMSVVPPEGAEVSNSVYWRRRLADGDIASAAPVALSQGDA